MILVADVDMLNDGAAVDVQEVFGRRIVVPSNGNLAFAQGMVEQFASGDALMSLRSRAAAFRPLTVVREMEAEAQKQYFGRLKALEDELQKTTEKLQELQKARGAAAKGAQIMTPEQQAEIENFRKTRHRDAPGTEGTAQEPAPGRRGAGVLDQGGEHRADAAAGGARSAWPCSSCSASRQSRHERADRRASWCVLLAALGGGALLVQQQADSQKPADAGSARPAAAEGPAGRRRSPSIAIREPKGALTIAAQGRALDHRRARRLSGRLSTRCAISC